MAKNTFGEEDEAREGFDWLPHGIDTSVFYPRERTMSRSFFVSTTGVLSMRSLMVDAAKDPLRGKPTAILPEEILIGIVATNQRR